jgi:hypothetical protein
MKSLEPFNENFTGTVLYSGEHVLCSPQDSLGLTQVST